MTLRCHFCSSYRRTRAFIHVIVRGYEPRPFGLPAPRDGFALRSSSSSETFEARMSISASAGGVLKRSPRSKISSLDAEAQFRVRQVHQDYSREKILPCHFLRVKQVRRLLALSRVCSRRFALKSNPRSRVKTVSSSYHVEYEARTTTCPRKMFPKKRGRPTTAVTYGTKS